LLTSRIDDVRVRVHVSNSDYFKGCYIYKAKFDVIMITSYIAITYK